MTDINKHPALRKLYETALSLERLPASPEQTATAILLADANRAVDALVDEVNRIQNVSIMSDFTLMAAQELREAVEPFRCDTFGAETPESERLDKACAALDRVHTNGLLKAAKDTEIARLKADNANLQRVITAQEKWRTQCDEAEQAYHDLRQVKIDLDAEMYRLKAENDDLVPRVADLRETVDGLMADLARVRGQRDRLALGYAATPSALESVGLRIVGGTVEEIGS